MGQGLAYRWARNGGYRIILGSRDRTKAMRVAGELRQSVAGADIQGDTNARAAALGDIIILTLPYAHRAAVLAQIADFLPGKLLVDTTVPLRPPEVGLVALPGAGSAAVEARAIVGENVALVAAFHNVSAHLLRSDGAIAADVLVAGDDADARERVIRLAAAAGMRAWHAGPLANAAVPEGLTSVLIQINRRYGLRSAGIRIVSGGAGHSATTAPDRLELMAVKGMAAVGEGDDLAALIAERLVAGGTLPVDGDILVVAQKIVSKSEGRMVRLSSVIPSAEALRLADETGKAPELVQVILNESTGIVRIKQGLIIVEHRSGMVLANAGVDQSNVPAGYALLLPDDPDRSAAMLRERLLARFGTRIAVIVSDSSGRAWRNGVVGHAIGVAGLDPLVDMRGRPDMLGRPLQGTQMAVADSIAAAATLMMGEAAESKPAVLVRGYELGSDHVGIQPLLRQRREDLFR